MRTVETILIEIYGSEAEAARCFGVVRSAVSNWKAWGYFPYRVLPQILADAETKGIELPVSEIPVLGSKTGTAA